jgi:hypothetical protein
MILFSSNSTQYNSSGTAVDINVVTSHKKQSVIDYFNGAVLFTDVNRAWGDVIYVGYVWWTGYDLEGNGRGYCGIFRTSSEQTEEKQGEVSQGIRCPGRVLEEMSHVSMHLNFSVKIYCWVCEIITARLCSQYQ